MKKLIPFALPLLLLLSFFVRTYRINQNPPSLNWDEVSHAYNAYSILKTQKDQWGLTLPTIFRVYGDYKLPAYIYLTIPSVALLGLTPLATRLVSILSGTLLVFLIYHLTKELLKKEKPGIKIYFPYFAALSVALSSWSVFLSRIAVEANLFLLLFISSLYFLIKTPLKSKNFCLSALFYALSLHTYNSSRVLLPFYLFFLFLAHQKLKSQKKIKTKKHRLSFGPILLFLSIFLFAYQTFFSDTGQARYQWVTLLDQGAINQINESRSLSTLGPFLAHLSHNKLTYFLSTATQNYLAHFNPRFLFVTGGDHYQFSLPGFWLVNPLLGIFFLLGLFYLIKKSTQKSSPHLLLLLSLLISPLPSAITRDAPHVLRSIIFFPLVEIISFLGLYQSTLFFKTKKSKIVFALPLVILFSTLVTFLAFAKMYASYAQSYAWAWQYGYQEAVEYIKENYDHYDRIWITKKYGEPHEFLLFHWPWDPASYQTDPQKVWDYHASWYWVDAFDKFKFINDWEIREKLARENPQNILLITSPGNYLPGNLLKTINLPDQSPVFDLVSY
jgi:4-amino-4-deoxy-L-arabinose transferase-like glycosyltransferase